MFRISFHGSQGQVKTFPRRYKTRREAEMEMAAKKARFDAVEAALNLGGTFDGWVEEVGYMVTWSGKCLDDIAIDPTVYPTMSEAVDTSNTIGELMHGAMNGYGQAFDAGFVVAEIVMEGKA